MLSGFLEGRPSCGILDIMIHDEYICGSVLRTRILVQLDTSVRIGAQSDNPETAVHRQTDDSYFGLALANNAQLCDILIRE